MKKVSEVDVHHIMSNGVLFNLLAPEDGLQSTCSMTLQKLNITYVISQGCAK
jgi:hypothetical protein